VRSWAERGYSRSRDFTRCRYFNNFNNSKLYFNNFSDP